MPSDRGKESKMKKILLLLVTCALLFVGCQKNGNSDSEYSPRDTGVSGFLNSQSSEASEASQEPPRDNHSLPDYNFSGTYYKLEVTPAVYDEDALLDYLIPGVDKSRAQKDNRNNYYSIEIDDIKHSWIYENNVFSYIKDDHTPDPAMTGEQALATADAFVKQSGFQVADNPEISKLEDGNYSVTYTFQYEGLPILGNDSINLKNGDEENDSAWGECIKITVSGKGIFSVFLSHLCDVTAVMEEYPQEKLLGKEQLESVIYLAMTSFYQDLPQDVEYDYRLEDIELLYIPWQENGKWVLIPAFRISSVGLENGEVVYTEQYDGTMGVTKHIMIVDAVTGYVYKR